MTDRLSIDKCHLDIINEFDKHDILNLKSMGDRSDIYMLAFSLGVHKGIRTPSKVKHGLILESVAKGKDAMMSYIYSTAIDDLRKDNTENLITDTNIVYTIAEEYANTGFEVIKTLIPDFSKYNEDDFVFSLIDLIDETYDSIIE